MNDDSLIYPSENGYSAKFYPLRLPGSGYSNYLLGGAMPASIPVVGVQPFAPNPYSMFALRGSGPKKEPKVITPAQAAEPERKISKNVQKKTEQDKMKGRGKKKGGILGLEYIEQAFNAKSPKEAFEATHKGEMGMVKDVLKLLKFL